MPRAVAAEIEVGPAEDRARQMLSEGRLAIVDSPPPTAELLAWDLGSGETAVLSFALSEIGWTAILEDAAARKCAQSLSIRIKGTLALVLMARKAGLIPSAAEVLRLLRASGFRIDDQTIRNALRQTVNEEWLA